MPSELPPLDIRYGPISWKMVGGWMVCDWCREVLATAGMTGNFIKEHHFQDPNLNRVWYPKTNTYAWVCNACNDLRFTTRVLTEEHPRGFARWLNEHMALCRGATTNGWGYSEPSMVLRHDIGIWCSIGGHGWNKWDEETAAMVGQTCDMSPHNGIWQARNQMWAWENKNEWCRCGMPANKQFDGEGIYYGHYCDTCWAMPEFDRVRTYKHDYLDAGEYLDAEDY